MGYCNACYFYEDDVCTNEDSPNYNTNVSWDDTCSDGEFDETMGESDDYDGDDEEDGFDED